MCGIFGMYTFNIPLSRQQIIDLIFKGLRRLEYRGYDSAGFAINGVKTPTVEADGAITYSPMIIKSQGNIDELELTTKTAIDEETVPLDVVFPSHVGISHTRWATHGPPSPVNSHPIASNTTSDFIVVHNGIITNFKSLKEFLTKGGDEFVTETDTEVVPKLCRYVYERLSEPLLFSQLVMEVLDRLEGAYAMLVVSRHYPGELVACRRGSPLILGVKQEEETETASFVRKHSFRTTNDLAGSDFLARSLQCIVASDASAVVEHTKKVIVLEDDDVLHVKGSGYGIFNRGHHQNREAAVPRVLQTLEMEINSIMKGGFQHFMQKEIHEQPESLEQTMRGRAKIEPSPPMSPTSSYGRHGMFLPPSNRVMLGGLAPFLTTIKRCRRLMLVACGTSYHACLAARPVLEELSDMPVTLELASDLMDRRCPIFRDDSCFFVSQSGETADTLAALHYAKERGALCIGVTNVVGSGISRATDCGMHLNAGPEIGVASTKAYTSQILALNLIAMYLGQDAMSKRNRIDEICDELGFLVAKVEKVLQLDEQIRELAHKLKDEHSLLFFGRGYNFCTAVEAALKVKEVALIHSEGFLAGEMKHGPLALVDDQIHLVCVVTQDNMHGKMLSVLQQLRARGGRLIVVCNEYDSEVKEVVGPECHLIEVPRTVDCLQPIINIVPLQLLSYHLTVLRGFNVDQPRNLAKSVTVTED